MTGMDEPVDPGSVQLAARLTVERHQRERCPLCTDHGCRQLDWAKRQLATPTRRPAA